LWPRVHSTPPARSTGSSNAMRRSGHARAAPRAGADRTFWLDLLHPASSAICRRTSRRLMRRHAPFACCGPGQCALRRHIDEGRFDRPPCQPLKRSGLRPPGPLTVYTIAVYTKAVLDQLDGFDWDAANVDHIMRHAVTPFEVKRRETLEAFRRDRNRPLLGRRVYHPPEAISDGDRLRDECR